MRVLDVTPIRTFLIGAGNLYVQHHCRVVFLLLINNNYEVDAAFGIERMVMKYSNSGTWVCR